MNELIILLTFEVLLFSFAFFMSNHDIMAPSVVMCIMFLLSTATALMNMNSWKIDYSPDMLMILVSGICVFIWGEIL